MSDRAPCCVPFCRRTIDRAKHPPGCVEFICGRCWSTIPKAIRRMKRRAERATDLAAARLGDNPPAQNLLLARAIQRESRLWKICKRRAIEAAAGLA